MAHCKRILKEEGHLGSEVGDRLSDLGCDDVVGVREHHPRLGVTVGLGHLPRGVAQAAYATRTIQPLCVFRQQRPRGREGAPVAVVEGAHQLRGHLQVLQLVDADGHVRRAIQQNVGRLQNWVEQQPERHLTHGCRLLLVLWQVCKPCMRRQAGEHPREFCMSRHRRLHEEHCP